MIFSMLGPRLTEEQASGFAAFAQWVVLNARGGRLLVDGIGEQANVETVMSMLTQAGRQPTIIGAWHEDGTPVEGYPLNEAEWLAVAPDEFDTSDPDNPVPVRPTAFREIHGWAGWSPKQP